MKALFGLIGKKLGHSFSAEIFNKKFGIENIDAEYRLIPIPDIENIVDVIRNNPDLKGFNVTVPYKEQILTYLDDISPEAAAIGAVNVVKVSRHGDKSFLKGYNSDIYGFTESLRPYLCDSMTKALILGSGGASKAVEAGLHNLGIESTIVSRSPVGGFSPSGQSDVISYSQLSEKLVADIHLIINATPLGMWPDVDACPPVPYESITKHHVCYDLVYNPSNTLFMQKASARGAISVNGLRMLHLQAERAWQIWTQDPT
ncbi:MAG: shikimate dehydrogenase [Muribaculum sp.]|nr:shikimate dehydrogenase [Muribaculum sp.]